MPLSDGDTFAGFRIIRLLGAGGMGEVYLAQHPRLPRRDALKLLPREWSADPDYRSRFAREADLASTLWHPHIVGVHDRGEHEGQLWISMDFVDGVDAGHLLADRYPAGMPLDEVATIVTAVASALDYAHKQGLLHRDIKPANIMLTHVDDDGDKRVLLTDFGIARNVDDISGLTTTNMTVGTVAYAAPEQLMGEDIDGRADQYALACTAYHLLAGEQLFPHSNPAVVISRHLNAAPSPLSDARPDLAALDPVFAVALAKNPEDRYARCQGFARDITAAATQNGAGLLATARIQQAPARTAVLPVSKGGRRVPVWTAVLVVAVLVGLVAVGTVLWSPWDQRDEASLPAPTSTTPTASAEPAPTATAAVTSNVPPPLVTSNPPPPSTTPAWTLQYPPASGALGEPCYPSGAVATAPDGTLYYCTDDEWSLTGDVPNLPMIGEWCTAPGAIGTGPDGTRYYCSTVQYTDGHQWSLTPGLIPRPKPSPVVVTPGASCMVPGSEADSAYGPVWCKPTRYGYYAWLP
ncbi:serine/threonine-protein kinase [Aldersonia sp. NBC_00410]|uniref:serine/threonine-protein kinase n=1 Tax=Aldersonia sp. NBC_00410 TaxID=2975954 RepID=UPI002B1DBD9C|nr:serine/threonine-protein kinase [Aldersonia sp. NBC_00410]